jgi:hypothetical protein
MTVSRELFRYRSHLVGVQEVRWEGSGTAPAGEHTFYMERGMRIMNWVHGFYIRESYQQLRRFEFVSDRTSYIILVITNRMVS